MTDCVDCLSSVFFQIAALIHFSRILAKLGTRDLYANTQKIRWNIFSKFLLSRRSRQRERLSATMLSICSSVYLFVAKMQKNVIFSKTKQFRAMVSNDDL